MKKLLYAVVLLLGLSITVSGYAQNNEDEVFVIVEEMPEFPGGMTKLAEYLAKNIQYPKIARESGIHGRVFVNFVVEPDGSVSNVKVMRTLGGGCDEEAVRVVQAMPKWKPGKQRGKAVRVSYNLPVNFQLQNPPQPKQITIVEDDVEVEDVEINVDVDKDEVIEEISFSGEEVDDVDADAEIFTIVEEMPEFPGGMSALSEYLIKNLRYPQLARENGIQGRVFVSFVVEPDGSVSNVNVMRSLGAGCDEEAVRLVKAMPRWKPGKQRGKAVRVSYLLPVNFTLK